MMLNVHHGHAGHAIGSWMCSVAAAVSVVVAAINA